MKIISADHHRNGVGGAPFVVAIFEDEDGSRKVIVDFVGDDGESLSGEYAAVLDIDKLAAGDVHFGSNSWRGDWFAHELNEDLRKVVDL